MFPSSGERAPRTAQSYRIASEMNTANELSPLLGKTVVFANRNARLRADLREIVSLLGATTIINVTNASDVVRLAREGSIDLILCDYQLDGVRDGQQLLEELRGTRQIPRSTMFMMITGERSYRKVMAVAEFAPDDYLLKPFTAGQMRERITAVALRKRVFARAHTLVEAGRHDDALAECREIRTASAEYAGEALRLMAEVMLTQKRHEDAEFLLRDVLARKPVAWAALGLARVRYAEGDLLGAEAGLADIVETHPEYLRATDMLARVKEDLGKWAEALAVLEKAGAAAQGNLNRLRHEGALAAQTGDHKKAAVLLEKVVARVRNSTLAKADDFVALADVYMARGGADQAARLSSEQRRIMGDAPDAELTAALMEFHRHRRDPSPAAQARAGTALDAVLAARRVMGETAEALTAAVDFDVFNACCIGGRAAEILSIGESLLARADASAKMVERVTTQLEEIKLQQARKTAIVPLDQVLAMLARMLAREWDDAVGDACRASVAHWTGLTPDDARLPAARERLAEVLRKFGMEAALDEPALAAA